MQIIYEKVHKAENSSPLDRNFTSNNYIPLKSDYFENTVFYPISFEYLHPEIQSFKKER